LSKELYALRMTEDATIIEHVNASKMLLNQLDFARAPMNEQIMQ
jgi:hypothetical protein